MMSSVKFGLGYDDFDNAPHLLAEADKRVIDQGLWIRASQDAICCVCGEKFKYHPQVQGALWLRRGCEGLVKL